MSGPIVLSPARRPSSPPDYAVLGKLPEQSKLTASARLLGSKIDTRRLGADPPVAELTIETGLTFAFRFGAVVTIGSEPAAIDRLDDALARFVFDGPVLEERESATITIGLEGDDRIGHDGSIQLIDASPERLLLIAIVLARSVVLAGDELQVSEAFERTAPLVSDLRDNGRARLSIRSALRLAGEIIAARHRVSRSAQAGERPDLLWDNPALDQLYGRLETEYELNQRSGVLTRKLSELRDLTEILIGLVQDKRAYRVEVAIILLIASEILITVFNVAFR